MDNQFSTLSCSASQGTLVVMLAKPCILRKTIPIVLFVFAAVLLSGCADQAKNAFTTGINEVFTKINEILFTILVYIVIVVLMLNIMNLIVRQGALSFTEFLDGGSQYIAILFTRTVVLIISLFIAIFARDIIKSILDVLSAAVAR